MAGCVSYQAAQGINPLISEGRLFCIYPAEGSACIVLCMKRLFLLKNEGVIVLAGCRARCLSAALEQASARSSGASSEQRSLPCPNMGPCCTSVVACSAQYLTCSHSDQPLRFNLFPVFPPFFSLFWLLSFI